MIAAQILAKKTKQKNEKNFYKKSYNITISLMTVSFLRRFGMKIAHPIILGKNIIKKIRNKLSQINITTNE